MQRVVADGFDGVENGEAATAKHSEVNAEALVNHPCERPSLSKQRASAGDEILHQAYVTFVKAALDDVLFGDSLGRGGVEWNINAALVEIARNVLPEIRQLQRRAGRIGEELAGFVTVATEVEDQSADRIGGIDAIPENGVPVRITLGGLILAKRF